MESEAADEVGLYNVVGQMLLPAIAYLLRDPAYAALPQRDPDFAELPTPDSTEGADFLSRAYAVVDCWAASGNSDLQNLVGVEFIEAGYSSLSVDDLTRHGGPHLQRLRQGPGTQ